MSIPSDMIHEENGEIYVVKGKKSLFGSKDYSSKVAKNIFMPEIGSTDFQNFSKSEDNSKGNLVFKGLRLLDGYIYNLKIKAIEDHNITSFEIRSAK